MNLAEPRLFGKRAAGSILKAKQSRFSVNYCPACQRWSADMRNDVNLILQCTTGMVSWQVETYCIAIKTSKFAI